MEQMADSGSGERPSNPEHVSRISDRTKVVLKIGAVILTTLVVTGYVVEVCCRIVAQRYVNAEIDKVRSLGEAVTLHEALPPAIELSRNAAVVLAPAIRAQEEKLLGPKEEQLGAWWPPDPSIDISEWPNHARAYAARYRDAIAMVREALTGQSLRLDARYEIAEDQWNLARSRIRYLCRALSAEATAMAMKGRGEQAVDNTLLILRLSDTYLDDPSGFALNSRLGCIAIAVNTIEAIMRLSDVFSQDDISALRGKLATRKLDGVITGTLMFERVMQSLELDAAIAAGQSPSELRFIGDRPSYETVVLERKLRSLCLRKKAKLWELAGRGVAVSRLPPWEAYLKAEALHAEANASYTGWPTSTSGSTYPNAFFVILRVARCLARRDACVLGLSCELFRSARGRYPATLDELAPEFLRDIPPDPFTGKPFRYELHDVGGAFIVYSVGDNLKDDDGVEDRPDKDDIAWEGRAPPADGTRGE
ncbi:MAG: hypothetical protein ACYS9X_04545 [Planctomycetota bacterium]